MSTQTLTVSLPTSTLYVSGTVNGVDTVWTNTSGQSWETTADRAVDEIYRVALTIIDDTGTATESRFTLYYGLHLITDRTLSDVESVKKLAEAIKSGTATEEQVQEYLSVHQKGAYTYEDLNRVESAVVYVANRLKEFGYGTDIQPVKTWTMENKPNKEDFDRYFWNIAQIRAAIAVWESTPEAPDSIVGFDVNKANALEQILVDVDQIINFMEEAWFYLGDLYMSEV
jgi:hypothetical protein